MSEAIKQLRRTRLELWRSKAGRFGMVNQAMAAWLLGVTPQRVAYLVAQNRLDGEKINGLMMVQFASCEQFVREKIKAGRPRLRRIKR